MKLKKARIKSRFFEYNIVKEKYNLVQDAEQSFWEYRKITSESAADQYALYNLENSLKKIADIK